MKDISTYSISSNQLFVRGGSAMRSLLLCLLLTIAGKAYSQEQLRSFSVIYKDQPVGYLKLLETKKGDDVFLKLNSDESVSFLLKVKVFTEEEALFRNTRLVYSNFYRKVNGNVKSDKQTRLAGDIYQTISNGKTAQFGNQSISHLLLLMYFREPINIRAVYSGNFQQFISVQYLSAHRYKIEFPDGSFTFFRYTNRLCDYIEIHHSMYTLIIK